MSVLVFSREYVSPLGNRFTGEVRWEKGGSYSALLIFHRTSAVIYSGVFREVSKARRALASAARYRDLKPCALP